MKLIKLLILIAIMLIAVQAPAEIYKYVDDEGNVYFTDDLNQVPADQREGLEANLDGDSNSETAEENAEENLEESAEADSG